MEQQTLETLEALQTNANVKVACYTTETMHEALSNGANVFLHVIADRLKTFGRDQGSEQLVLDETEPGERFGEAFFKVGVSRGWQEKCHLVLVSEMVATAFKNRRIQAKDLHMMVLEEGAVGRIAGMLDQLRDRADV